MPAPSPRLYFLDWTRIIAFGLLILYHVGMYFVSWDWHVKHPDAGSPGLEALMRLSSPWRMSLLFLVSGAATAAMVSSTGASAAWLRGRVRRLGLPLLFGIAVIVPPQSYFEVVQKHGFDGSYLAFMRLYLTGHGGFCGPHECLILPTWNHLWFLPYLLVYTLLLWVALMLRADALDRGGRLLARSFDGASPAARSALLLAAPVLVLTAARIALRDAYPVTHALVGDWYAHAQYLPMFVGGALMSRMQSVWSHLERARWPALGLALVGWAMLVTDTTGVPRPLAYATQQWCAIVAAIGFAHRWLDFDAPARAGLNEAVFPVYIVHQTLIVLLAVGARPLALPPAIEGVLIAVATIALGLATFALVRRFGMLRPLFGLAPARSAPRDDGPGARAAA